MALSHITLYQRRCFVEALRLRPDAESVYWEERTVSHPSICTHDSACCPDSTISLTRSAASDSSMANRSNITSTWNSLSRGAPLLRFFSIFLFHLIPALIHVEVCLLPERGVHDLLDEGLINLVLEALL